jgi:hypothetical protein
MGISQTLISSLTQVVDDAVEFIKELKRRVVEARALTAAREATIVEKDAVIAARDTTIVERNLQIDANLILIQDLQAEVVRLGGSLADFEARYAQLMLDKEAALVERATAEQARLAAEQAQAALLAEKDSLLAAEAEEDRLDAIEISKLEAAIGRLATEATE